MCTIFNSHSKYMDHTLLIPGLKSLTVTCMIKYSAFIITLEWLKEEEKHTANVIESKH